MSSFQDATSVLNVSRPARRVPPLRLKRPTGRSSTEKQSQLKNRRTHPIYKTYTHSITPCPSHLISTDPRQIISTRRPFSSEQSHVYDTVSQCHQNIRAPQTKGKKKKPGHQLKTKHNTTIA